MAGANIFNKVKVSTPSRNVFDLSHDHKTSGNMGWLMPICIVDTLPGGTYHVSNETLLRFMPMIAPIMHRVNVYVHYFHVENRILWENWDKYWTNANGNESDLPVYPYVNIHQNAGGMTNYNALCDYLGIPKDLAESPDPSTLKVSAFPFAAYHRVWWEYYRDQNLIQPNVDPFWLDDGDNTPTFSDDAEFGQLRRRAWEHDYFTSALPFAQKGDVVELPLGAGTVQLDADWELQGTPVWRDPSDASAPAGAMFTDAAGATTISPDPQTMAYDPSGTLTTDPEAVTINELRAAFRLQEWLEKMARGGSRPTEVLKMFFNVNSPDGRMQRPEYVAGSRSPVVISEVLNTTGTDVAAQGAMAGHGVTVVNPNRGSFYAYNHGWLIGIMSVMPKPAYMQGIDRKWLKYTSPTELFWPQFAHLGEQAVMNQELFAFTNLKEGTFGYLPRYMEHRFESNRVSREMRDTLDHWHLARRFENLPGLNKEFIECDPSHRIFAVEDESEDKLVIHCYNKIKAILPVPKFGTPTF